MSRDDRMRDVELVDGDVPTYHGATRLHGNGRPGGGPGTTSQARRRWLTAAGLGLLLAVAVLADGIQDRGRAARLASLEGVLEPLDGSLREVWTQPGGWQHPAVHGPDLMVSLFPRGDAFRLVANDLVTGQQRWDVALPDVHTFGAVSCLALGPEVAAPTGPSTHVACRLAATASSATRLLVLDAHTGETVGERDLDDPFGTVTALGADVALATVADDRRMEVRREDALTGRVRWTTVSEHPLPGSVSRRLLHPPALKVEHGVVVVTGPTAIALSPTGELLGEWPAEELESAAGPVEVTVLADGRFVAGSTRADPDVPYGSVSGSDRRDGFAVDGPPLYLAVDDGSAPGTLLTAPGTGEIVALDARTGETRWTAAATPLSGAVLLDHRLITTDGSDLIALDVSTGERLWTAAGGVRADHDLTVDGLLTDGDVVIVPTADIRGPMLTAVDVVDGELRWTAAGPRDVVAYFEIGRRLIALQPELMTRLG
ncbi:PQQ-binding-like beta-propeller repeat protein [Actinotalea sp. Marseille-Q4924]|uniref:outer membrane protein assembly factor BamB family protein n=1 Tax=Actinotalea sp. Marseille-Q4924 TaxID=2866571 RepID=UPI001CE466A0|nr:PQQ-binding-like beta-propeller repeat protein [Actinotalea sp. Marseille-Q4924]